MDFAGGTPFGVRVSPLVASMGVLVLVGLADALLRWIVRVKVRHDEAAAATAPVRRRELLHWLDRSLTEAVPPFALFIWVIGGYAALSMALVQLTPGVARSAIGAAAVLRDVGMVAALFWLLVRTGRVLERFIASLATRTANGWDDELFAVAGMAVRVLLPIVAIMLGAQLLPIPAQFQPLVRHGLSLTLIGATALLLYRGVEAAEQLVLRRYQIDEADNLEARAVYTQVTVLKKIATTVIVIFTLASMLMVFESVRQFGTSILASAGIAGIIIGFAAQRSIATLLAGLQIAITQPIRLDDVVIVESEWGRIEEITLTYVAVRIWDQRRLIVPITYFIEQPFQNWTRTSAEILGTVYLYVDYRAPLDAIRQELDRILRSSPHWDGRVNGLQVTDAREHTLEIRALSSAADASLAWDLRCEVREKLVDYLQRHHPESLPRVRAELQPAISGTDGI